MNVSKSVLGTIAGAVIATVVTFAAIKYNSDPAVVADEPAPAAVVTPVDPNQAAVQIAAPTDIKVGELAVLDVSSSNANSFAWKCVPETKNFIVIDGGKRAVFSSEVQGEYLFIVSAAKGDTVDSQIHKVKVGGGGSAPAVADISTKVPGWVDKVQSPSKRDEALRLAQSFSSVAAMITPNMTGNDIVAATVKSNRDALGANIKNWEPFLAQLQVELEARAADGSLSNADSHTRMWRSISAALTEYANRSPATPTPTSSKWRGR